jgi:hypothetical protein
MASYAFSSAGTKFSLSAGVPATFNEAGFSALTYTVVEDITDLGAIGPESAVITHAPLSENSVYKFKSTRNNGQLSLKGGRAAIARPGQTLLQAAEASNAPYAIKIELQNGTVIYAQGLVMSYKTNIGSQGQITGFESNIEISGDIYTVDAA